MVRESFACTNPHAYTKSIIIFFLLFIFISFPSVINAQNLTINKTGPILAAPGDTLHYKINYANSGLKAATNVIISDILPDPNHYTYLSSSPAGVYNAISNTISWSATEIPELSSLGAVAGEITVELYAGTQAPNTYFYIPTSPIIVQNYASIESTELAALNSQIASTTLEQYCGLTFSPIDVGEVKSSGNSTVRYLVNVINQGNIYDQFTIDTLQMGHPLEDKILDISLFDLAGNPLTITDWIAPGGAFFYVDVLLDAPTSANTFNYVDIIGTSNLCGTSASTTITTKIHNPAPNKALLLLSKLDSTDPVKAGDTLNYTIYIYNYSTFDTEDLVATETYDSNVSFLSASPAPDSGDNIWNLAPLTGGDFTTIEVSVIVDINIPNGTVLTNSVIADATNADAADATTTTTLVEAHPDLKITKTASTSNALPQENISYTLTYTNLGNLTAENIIIMDDYDESHLSITNPNGGSDNGDFLVYYLPDLAPGSSLNITYDAKINAKPSFDGGTTNITNTAQISTSTTEINLNNNIAIANVYVSLLPDLTITLSASDEPVLFNQAVTYTISVSNLGNYRSTNVLIQNTLPAGLTFVSASDGGILAGGIISWPIIDTVHISNVLERTFIAIPDCSSPPSVFNTAQVSNDILETEYSNNTVSLETTIENSLSFINCPSNLVLSMDPGICGAIVNFNTPIAEDLCGNSISTIRTDATGLNSGDLFPEGTVTISYSATNSKGETVFCSFDITVLPDTEPPVIHNVPADFTLECSDCIQAFENNDFEEPPISGSWASIDAAAISGWSTTAADNRIEIQKSGMIDGVVSYSGNQHAELNGNNVGDFYQEFCTVPTTTVQISFAHHKRMGSVNTTDDIMQVLTGPDLLSLDTLGIFTATSTSGWTVHTVDFPIPPGQSSTVFVFRAVQGAPGNTTYGNLIDDINVITLFDASNVPSATDNCGLASLSLFEEKVDGSCLNDYQINRTWTALDINGNTSVATQTLIVGDVSGPDFTMPPDIILNCSQDPTDLSITGTISNFFDNCDPAPIDYSFSDVLTPGSCPNKYTIIRTWTLIDHCNNSTSKDQIIRMDDSIPPVFVEVLPADFTVDCGTTLTAAPTLTATDDCGTASVDYTENTVAGTCPNNYTLERIWTATDECGNNNVHTQTITFQDITAPTWSTLAGDLDRIVECSDPTDYNNAIALVPVATDNCGSITIVEQPEVVGVCVGSYTVTRKWVATDDCGNSSTAFTQIITVEDSTPPDITTAASDLDVECDGSGNTTELNDWLDNYGGAIASDNCSIISWTNDFTSLSDLCGETGDVTVTFTATDNCGNFANTSATFNIIDSTPPVIDIAASDLSVECDGAGNTTELNDWLDSFGGANADDNCGTITWTNDYTSLSDLCGETGTALVTFTATDECGNDAITSANFTITDTTDPTITTEASNTTVECDGSGNATEYDTWIAANANAIASDICGGSITWSTAVVSETISCGDAKEITVDFIATDECGNSAASQAIFIIEDNTAPTWSTVAGDLDRIVECSDPTDYNNAMALVPVATDNCGSITIVEQPEVVGVCVGSYTVTRKWVATDDCGNESAVFTQVITVEDSTPPDITTAASDLSVECDGSGNTTELNDWLDNYGGAFASDNCSIISWTNDFTSLSDLCGATGAVLVTFTATDNCGNFASTSATFSIIDGTPPTITTSAADLVVECDGSGNSIELNDWLDSFGGAIADDNCGTITWTNDYTSLSDLCGETGTALVTFTATDECGNYAITSANFTITDTTDPTITTEASNTTVECDGSGNDTEYDTWIAANANAIASDICGGSITWSTAVVSETISCGDAKEITVDFIATDECGNSAASQAIFIIEDNTAPTWSTVAGDLDRTVECSDPTDYNNAMALVPVATDNCGSITIVEQPEVVGVCDGSYTLTRTWIASDDCGNDSAPFTQIITVEDSTPPDITTTASDLNVECDGSGNTTELNDWLDNYGGAIASDNCSIISWTNDFTSLSDLCSETGSVLVTFTATDNCGNFANTSATFNIIDSTPPVIDISASDLSVECDGAGNTTELNAWLDSFAGASANDGCGSVSWSNNFTVLSNLCAETGTALVTFTATDECGNDAITSANFTITDTTDPTITTEASNTTVECDGSGNATEYDTWIAANAGASASDICGGSITWSTAVVSETISCGDAKEITVDFIATDECGNSAASQAIFIIEDNTSPTWSTVAGDLDRTVECSDPTDYNNAIALEPVATDNCGSITIVEQPEVVGVCDGSYTLTRTWIASDDCGNESAVFTQVITVEDSTPPDITTEASDLSVECDGAGNLTELNTWLANNGGAIAFDNCSHITWTNDYSSLSDLCGETGAVLVTFTATDNCGNFANTSATFNIIDSTPPVIDIAASNLSVECDGAGNTTELNAWLDSFAGASASDGCGSVSWSNNFTVLSNLCAETGTALVTFTATDECGNDAITSASFTIEDTTAPTITTEASNTTVECDGSGNATEYDTWIAANAGASASDICGGTISWSTAVVSETISCGDAKEITVDFIATDECGNSATSQAIFIIEDNTAPTWSTVAGDLDRIVECSDPTDYNNAIALVPVATDNCGSITIVEQPEVVGVCVGSYTLTRTWVATDDCGNSSTAFTQIITVEDSTPPDITTAASDLSVECDGAGNLTELNTWLANNGGAIAFDNCSHITWTNDFTSLSDLCGETGDVTITFTATDNCGNFASTSTTFSIIDGTPPAITTSAADIVVECDGAGNTTELNDWLDSFGGAIADDNCGTITWTNDYTSLSDLCGETGTALVTFTATDECGNDAITSASFTIEDTTAPTITTEASNTTVECDGSGNATEYDTWIAANAGASASNICGGSITWSTAVVSETISCGDAKEITVDFIATDECGNSAASQAIFIIEDNTAPTWSTVAGDLDRIVECSDPTDYNNAIALVPVATDNCGSITIVEQPEVVGVCVGSYTLTRTWVATDDCGNSSTAFTQIITVEDSTPPDITTAASDLSVECDGAGNLTELNTWLANNGGAIAFDNCSHITWTNDFTSLSDLCGETGSVLVTFTATDNCGNFASTSATFSIIDGTPPVILTDATDLTVECDGAGNTTELNDWLDSFGGAIADDNCGTITWTNDYTSLSDLCGETGTALVTFTATDECGNYAITSASFTIEDTTPPTIDISATDLTVECDGSGNTSEYDTWIAANAGASASDICGGTISWSTAVVSETISCGDAKEITVDFIATDECGNSATSQAIFIIEDNTSPTWSTVAGDLDRTVECSSPLGYNDAMALLPAAIDNCGTITITEQPEVVGVCDGSYTLTRTWIASDDCGNESAVFTQIITVEDSTPPDITTAASDLSVECDGAGNLTELNDWLDNYGGAIAFDNCSHITWTNDFTSLSDLCGETGAVLVTFTATDNCGNFASTSATFSITDGTPPVISTDATDLTVECDGAGNTTKLNDWLDSFGGAIADDNCGTITWTNDFTSLSDLCGETGTAQVTFTATDECGNDAITSANFTITDTTDPTITTEASNTTVECDGSGNTSEYDTWIAANANAIASDICGGSITWSTAVVSETISCGDAKEITVDFIATDECGNSAASQAIFIIEDNTSPTWSTVAGDLDRTVECSDPTDYNNAIALVPVATDNCGSITIVEQPEVVGVCVGSYTITRTWVATDDCGNDSAPFTQIITVEDSTPPDITTAASDLDVECDGSGNPTELNDWLDNYGGAIASDNCSDIVWTNDYSSLSDLCGATGAVLVTFTATDNCGNFSSTSATFSIVDGTPPVISTDATDLTVECDGAGNTTELNDWLDAFGGAIADDNCGTITWSNNYSALSDLCAETGTALVTFTATDECGNYAITSASFTIEDTTSPQWLTASGSLDQILDCSESDGLTAALKLVPEAIDLCGDVWLSAPKSTIISSSCPNSYTLERTWIYLDDCGNESEPFVQTISIEDSTPPLTEDLIDVFLDCSDDLGLSSALALKPSFTDDCTPPMLLDIELISNDIVYECANTYTQTRIWKGTDLCGNSSQSQQVIYVSDTTPPSADLLDDLFFFCKSDITAPNNLDIENAVDNCSETININFVSDISDGNQCPENIVRTYLLSDDCGNETLLEQLIIVDDTIKPTADLLEDLEFARIEDVPFPNLDILTNVLDNCTENPFTYIISTELYSTISPPYYIHYYGIEDNCANQTITSQILYINDFPLAEDDEYTIEENSIDNKFNILTNDIFGFDGPKQQCLRIDSEPFYGRISLNDNGTQDISEDDFFVYTPFRNTYEDDGFEYSIIDKTGDESNAYVRIKITPNPLHIPEAYSPNGDGINEFFHIRGLYYYPNNAIIIYDEKGNKVFEAAPYQNNWGGKNHFSVDAFETLPQATYFYILNLGDGRKPIKGYVYINRLN